MARPRIAFAFTLRHAGRAVLCGAAVAVGCAAPLEALAATSATSAASSVHVEVGLARPVLLAGQRNIAHVRVSVIGEPAPAGGPRPEANVCIAIDRSGSMGGEKIANARRGALSALERLRPTDIVSVVAYDDVVDVLVPATRASDRGAIDAGIARLEARGGTGLFAGVVKCAEEVRKLASRNRVNRIVLLSDGMANIGPSSPAELGMLGSELAGEGISVATVELGDGYNEDLMVELALRSDGRHTFVERAEDLAAFLDQELGSVTAVVARDVEVRIQCAGGARPLRVLGRLASIVGNTVTATFGKIYGRRQHFFVLEIEVDSQTARGQRSLADVDVGYHDLLADRDARQRLPVLASFTARKQEVEARANPRIMSELGLLNADAATETAIKLRDQGDFAGAQRLLEKNAVELEETARRYRDPRLVAPAHRAREKSKTMSPAPAEWNIQRKIYKRDVNDALLNGL